MLSTQLQAAIVNASTKTLIGFYNDHAIKEVKKFADRKTTERRVQKLIQDILENTDDKKLEKTITAALRGTSVETLETESKMDEAEIAAWNNGVATHEAPEGDGFTNVTEEQHAEHRDEKIAGEGVNKSTRNQNPLAGASISASMKLDRRTRCVETGEEWCNAGKVYNDYAGSHLTYSQGDKLTYTLYSAAKRGEKAQFVAEGEDGTVRTFELVNIQSVI
jgi:hypothetical protein